MGWDRFKKLEQIGHGGMGVVWRAYDRDTGSIVALKEIRHDLAREKDFIRFFREINYLTSIKSEYIIRLTASNPDPNYPAYAMEYCPQGDLYKWLSVHRTRQDKEKCFKDICKGVGTLHLHQKRLIHRDIKPSNILLSENSNIKISDFGLSLSLEDEAIRVTTSNWVSEGFSAPEQFHRMATVTQSADVYSVGAVTYFMFTGSDCSSPPNLDDKQIPLRFRIMLKWMLAEDPNDRIQSMAKALVLYNEIFDLTSGTNIYDIARCPKCRGPLIRGDDLYGRHMSCLTCHYEQDGIVLGDQLTHDYT